jgi:hypothetical protein
MRFGLIIFSFVFIPFFGYAQSQEIMSGVIVDSATFAPLPYVNVQIKGTYKGTSTDLKGKFSVMASKEDTLIISFLGYETIEMPLYDWEASVIRLAERPTMLKSITIEGQEINPYEGLFDEQDALWKKEHKAPRFYYNRAKKQKINLSRAKAENLKAQTYVNVVIKNPETKGNLMKKYKLTETEYYNILADFNQRNYTIMYYLTAPELLTLLNNFYARKAGKN